MFYYEQISFISKTFIYLTNEFLLISNPITFEMIFNNNVINNVLGTNQKLNRIARKLNIISILITLILHILNILNPV